MGTLATDMPRYARERASAYETEMLAAMYDPRMIALARQDERRVAKMVRNLVEIHPDIGIAALRSEMSQCLLCLRLVEDFDRVNVCAECRAAMFSGEEQGT